MLCFQMISTYSTNNSWLLRDIIVVEGNFKADHLHPKNPQNDISLTDGEAYVTNEERYSKHLKEGKTFSQVGNE